MSDKSMKLEQAMFILRHGSAEGEHKYFEAISVIEKAYNRLKAENKNCGKTILNQREQLKAGNEKIKEQQAEIERLESKVNRLKRYDEERDIRLHARLIANAKSEAYKEFAERLKEKDGVPMNTVDNLLKEMGCGD